MNEPYSSVRPEDHHLWSCYDEDATEDEVINLIGSLVRALKPTTVVEVGSHLGHTSEVIGCALKGNGRGHLYSYEIVPQKAQVAQHRVRDLPVSILSEDANVSRWLGFPVDFLFIDGNLDNREVTWDTWLPRLSEEALVLVHDSRKYPEVERFVDDVVIDLGYDYVNLPTPRGLAIIQSR